MDQTQTLEEVAHHDRESDNESSPNQRLPRSRQCVAKKTTFFVVVVSKHTVTITITPIFTHHFHVCTSSTTPPKHKPQTTDPYRNHIQGLQQQPAHQLLNQPSHETNPVSKARLSDADMQAARQTDRKHGIAQEQGSVQHFMSILSGLVGQ